MSPDKNPKRKPKPASKPTVAKGDPATPAETKPVVGKIDRNTMPRSVRK